jgi:hypothetical protein
MPQILSVLLKRAQVQTLLGDGPGGVGLQVEHLLHGLLILYWANTAMSPWK